VDEAQEAHSKLSLKPHRMECWGMLPLSPPASVLPFPGWAEVRYPGSVKWDMHSKAVVLLTFIFNGLPWMDKVG
jgi:hypothetical protein